jgi:hypothetical protein
MYPRKVLLLTSPCVDCLGRTALALLTVCVRRLFSLTDEATTINRTDARNQPGELITLRGFEGMRGLTARTLII